MCICIPTLSLVSITVLIHLYEYIHKSFEGCIYRNHPISGIWANDNMTSKNSI